MSSLAPGHPGSTPARLLPMPLVRRPSRVMWLILVLLAMAPPAYLLQTGGALSTGYDIQKLERERTVWLNRNQQLEVEIARARSLAWVEHEAVHRLGMQRPAQTLSVRVDGTPPTPPETRLLRRGSEPMPTTPVEEGPGWLQALGALGLRFGQDD